MLVYMQSTVNWVYFACFKLLDTHHVSGIKTTKCNQIIHGSITRAPKLFFITNNYYT